MNVLPFDDGWSVAGPKAPPQVAAGHHPSYTWPPAHGRTRIAIHGARSRPERTLVHRGEDRITSAAMLRPLLAALRRSADV